MAWAIRGGDGDGGMTRTALQEFTRSASEDDLLTAITNGTGRTYD